MTQIEYTGPGVNEQVSFSDCTFCDVNDVGPHTLIRYQQDEGWTIWALYVDKAATVGAHPLTTDYSGDYVTLAANNQELPGPAQGFYFADSVDGTVTYTTVDHGPGGLIEGSVDVTLQLGDVSAHLQASFSAEVP